MPKTIYCWRCKIEVPMLTEDEWQLVNPNTMPEQLKQYRKETDSSLSEVYRNSMGLPALVAYERITGFRETNPNALKHHRLKLIWPRMHRLRQTTSDADRELLCRVWRKASKLNHAAHDRISGRLACPNVRCAEP